VSISGTGREARRLRFSGLVVALALAASACGGSATGSASPEPVGSSQPTADSSTPPEAVTIEFWHTYGESAIPWVDEQAALFKDKFPWITVEQEPVPSDVFMTRLITALQAGGGPDVILTSRDQIAPLVAAEALLDISAPIAEWEDREQIPEEMWAGGSLDGAIYGVPIQTYLEWMYYRKDLFDEAGLAPPTDWDSMLAGAIALTDPAQQLYGFGMRGGSGGDSQIMQWVEANGGRILDDEGNVVFDSPETVGAIQWFSDLKTKYGVVPPSAVTDGFQEVFAAFEGGNTAMLIHHTSSAQRVRDALGDKVLSIPIPAGPVKQVGYVDPALQSVISTSENKEAAFEWARWWAELDTQSYWFDKLGYWPTRLDTAEQTVANNPFYDAARETLEKSATRGPSFPEYSEWRTASVIPTFQQVLLGELTPAAAVTQMAEALKQLRD